MFSSENTPPINLRASTFHSLQTSLAHNTHLQELTSSNGKSKFQSFSENIIQAIFSKKVPAHGTRYSNAPHKNPYYTSIHHPPVLKKTTEAKNSSLVKTQQVTTVNKVRNSIPQTLPHTRNYINTTHTIKTNFLQTSSLPHKAVPPLAHQKQLKIGLNLPSRISSQSNCKPQKCSSQEKKEAYPSKHTSIDIGLKPYQPGLYTHAYYDHIYFRNIELENLKT